MITFNELSSRIANILGRVNDHALRERAKAAFKDVFATRIRQSIERNGIEESLLFTIQIPLEEDTEKSNSKFVVYKSSIPVPTPARIANDAPFTNVTVNKPNDDFIPFSHRSEMEIRLSVKRKLGGLSRYYTYNNSILRLYFTSDFQIYATDLSEVLSANLTTIYEDLEQIVNLYTNEKTENYPIPYPRDMIESILAEILKVEFNYNPQDSEVKS